MLRILSKRGCSVTKEPCGCSFASTYSFLVLIQTSATYNAVIIVNKLTFTELPCTVEIGIGLTGIAEVAAVDP